MRWPTCTLFVLAMAYTAKATAAGPDVAQGAGDVTLQLTSTAVLPACLTLERLRTAVEDRLGRPVFREDTHHGGHEPLAIKVSLARAEANVWDLQILALRQGMGSIDAPVRGLRRLRVKAATCEDLMAPLTLIVTLSIDPAAQVAPAKISVPATESSPRATSPPTDPIKPPPAPWKFAFGFGAGASTGNLPKFPWLWQARIVAAPRAAFALALVVGYQSASETAFDRNTMTQANTTFDSRSIGIEVQSPLWWRLAGLVAQHCHLTKAQGRGFDVDQRSRTYGCASSAGLMLSVPVAQGLALFTRGELAFPWQRERFLYRLSDGSAVQSFTTSLLSVTVAAGAQITF